jgi:hypothetical protein
LLVRRTPAKLAQPGGQTKNCPPPARIFGNWVEAKRGSLARRGGEPRRSSGRLKPPLHLRQANTWAYAGTYKAPTWMSVMSASDNLTEALMTGMSALPALMSQVFILKSFVT